MIILTEGVVSDCFAACATAFGPRLRTSIKIAGISNKPDFR